MTKNRKGRFHRGTILCLALPANTRNAIAKVDILYDVKICRRVGFSADESTDLTTCNGLTCHRTSRSLPNVSVIYTDLVDSLATFAEHNQRSLASFLVQLIVGFKHLHTFNHHTFSDRCS